MAKPIPVRKKTPKKKFPTPREDRERGWAALGFDISLSSIAGAGVGYDKTLDRYVGPEFVMVSFDKGTHYFERLKTAARAHEIVMDLLAALKLSLKLDEIFISQEEPFPPHGGFMRRGISQSLKQQAEISGAFLGGLLRFGYVNISQIGNHQWRQVIAADLGITIHHSKWRSPELAAEYNCKPVDSGKFRAKQWAANFSEDPVFRNKIPDWPDLIVRNGTKISRPDSSTAKAVQCDDRFDSLAIMQVQLNELVSAGIAPREVRKG
jgi:hypothetical protein